MLKRALLICCLLVILPMVVSAAEPGVQLNLNWLSMEGEGGPWQLTDSDSRIVYQLLLDIPLNEGHGLFVDYLWAATKGGGDVPLTRWKLGLDKLLLQGDNSSIGGELGYYQNARILRSGTDSLEEDSKGLLTGLKVDYQVEPKFSVVGGVQVVPWMVTEYSLPETAGEVHGYAYGLSLGGDYKFTELFSCAFGYERWEQHTKDEGSLSTGEQSNNRFLFGIRMDF